MEKTFRSNLWYKVYLLLPCFRTTLRKVALKRMAATAKTCGDWWGVSVCAPLEGKPSKLHEAARDGMAATAKTFPDWRTTWGVAVSYVDSKDLVETALEHMASLAKTSNQWRVVYDCAPKDSATARLAKEKLAA